MRDDLVVPPGMADSDVLIDRQYRQLSERYVDVKVVWVKVA